jgi:hypothetical protein
MPTLACNLGDAPKLTMYFGVNGTQLAAAVARGDTTARFYDVSGYADADAVLINAPELRMDRLTIATSGVVAATRIVTFTTGFLHAHAIDQTVYEAKNPTAVVLTYTNPNGLVTTKAIGDLTSVATGHYTYDGVTMDVRGTWRVDVTCTGTVVAGAETSWIEVR